MIVSKRVVETVEFLLSSVVYGCFRSPAEVIGLVQRNGVFGHPLRIATLRLLTEQSAVPATGGGNEGALPYFLRLFGTLLQFCGLPL